MSFTDSKVNKGGDDTELLRSDSGIEINNSNLYDLNDADELYEKFVTKYGRNITKNVIVGSIITGLSKHWWRRIETRLRGRAILL